MMKGKMSQIKPEDLLGRKILKIDLKPVGKVIDRKSILITGAAGSIGSETARQVARFKPKIIVCLDWWENGLYDLELELTKKFPKGNFKFVIANIQDTGRISHCLENYKPEIVFHAAAYKHVPLMEENPTEAIKNNVLATYDLAKLAVKNNVKKFIFLSTDKTINPTSVMGASKLLAEHIIQYFNQKGKTKFVSVRFCNVLDSFGSVVPIFKKQIKNGGPVTVTDPCAYRYFMTIPEAVQLILQAATIGKGGEIFVLDIGDKPIKIIDLARNLIKLSPGSDRKIKIKIIGLRPGEKVSEENQINSGGVTPTSLEKTFLVKNNYLGSKKLLASLKRLKKLIKIEDNKQLVLELRETLKSYRPWNERK